MIYILYDKVTNRILSKSEIVPKVMADQIQIGNATMSGIDWAKMSLGTTEDIIDDLVGDVSQLTIMDIDYKSLIPIDPLIALEARITACEKDIAELKKP